MNSVISFTLKDLGLFVLWGLLSAVLLYILLILFRFYRSMKHIMKMIDEKRTEIDQVIDELPGITKSINTITGEVAHASEAFHPTVDNVAETSTNVTGAIADKSDALGQMSSIFHVASMAKNMYDQFFGDQGKEAEEESVMVCREVPKSSVQPEAETADKAAAPDESDQNDKEQPTKE